MTMGLFYDKHWQENHKYYSNLSLSEGLADDDTLTEKICTVVNILKHSDIRGCITGSTTLDEDFDSWESAPDIDVFVYSPEELINTCAFLQYKLGMVPGKGTERSHKQESWKLNQLRKRGASKKIPITSHSFYYDGVIVNATVKTQNGRVLNSINEVLGSFDMSIIMRGYDIHGHFTLDLRFGDPHVATPNLMRDHDPIMWNTAKWIRQFDRVVKYYNRGFDTRPMAEFYLKMINDCIEAGCLFDSDASKDTYDSFVKEFVEQRERISEWLDQHKED